MEGEEDFIVDWPLDVPPPRGEPLTCIVCEACGGLLRLRKPWWVCDDCGLALGGARSLTATFWVLRGLPDSWCVADLNFFA